MSTYNPFFARTKFLKKMIEWVEKLRPTSSFIKNLNIIYEWEYKRHKIVAAPMVNEKRKDSIIKELDRRLQPILESVTNDLIKTYKNWLHEHTIFDHMGDVNLWLEWRYGNGNEVSPAIVISDYEAFAKKEGKYDKSIINYFHSLPKDKESLLLFAKEYTYPLWTHYWKGSSIVKVKKNIEEVYKKLLHLKHSNDVKEQITEINIALHTAHQTGSMKYHVSLYTDAEESQLDDLTNIDNNTIKKWDEDLVEMGIW